MSRTIRAESTYPVKNRPTRRDTRNLATGPERTAARASLRQVSNITNNAGVDADTLADLLADVDVPVFQHRRGVLYRWA